MTDIPTAIQKHPLLSQWVAVDPIERRVTVLTGKVELGQGISTAFLQIACDALCLAPEQVQLISGHTEHSPDEGWTAGSLSIQYGGAALNWACRHACAAFRDAAAIFLGVSPGEVHVMDGVFRTEDGLRETDYWALCASVKLDFAMINPPPSLSRNSSASYVGRSLPRIDFLEKFTGAGYIHDLDIPGMQHVRMLRGRHVDQRLTSVPLADLEALDGVRRVVHSGQFLALMGPDEGPLVRAAKKARSLLHFSDITDGNDRHEVVPLLLSLPSTTNRVHESGTAKEVKQWHSASYSRPYLAHASIGPSCAVADPRNGKLRVWSHTQGPHQLKAQIARALDLDMTALEVIHLPGAGCYGHNGADDAAFDAAFVAIQTGLPVRVQWMREDEMSTSPFGSASVVKLSAGLDADGQIGAWGVELWSHTHLSRPGWGDGVNLLGAWEIDSPWPRPLPQDVPLPMGGADRNAIAIYDFPHQQIDYHFIADSPLRVSALRSLGSYANLFAIECFMDELAELQNCDPLAFRLQHLNDSRAKAVLQTVAEMANWADRSCVDAGKGLGIGFGRYKNTAAYCAIITKVNVEEKIHIEKVWIAVDAGAVVNPDGLINQIEGGTIQSLSWTLKESVTWDTTGVTSCDWENYPILGFDEIPQIEIKVLDQPAKPSLGAGEAAAGPTAASVANAVAHALGLRARHLPLTPERLMELIAEQ